MIAHFIILQKGFLIYPFITFYSLSRVFCTSRPGPKHFHWYGHI